jgi:hypothetical protein
MTKFVKDAFQNDGDYLRYDGQFVARFKYAKGSRATFVTFLIKNFTVEEYFARLGNREAPLQILQSRGYLQPHIKKMLRDQGYSMDAVGYQQFIQDRVKALDNRKVELPAVGMMFHS